MTHAEEHRSAPTVAIVGGGLAGLAAAVAAAGQGLRVELFEARRRLGGRAGSFRDPKAGTTVDFCQHVAMGCCINLLDFCSRTGIADELQRSTTLNFFGPDGRRYAFAPSSWLPAPLHLGPALLGLGYLTRGERWSIARTLGRLGRMPAADSMEDQQTIGAWLRRYGQSERMIERFWSVVLQSALGETVDRASIGAARKVFVDGFIASRRACELLVPRTPLGEILDRRVAMWLADRNASLHLGTRVRQIDFQAGWATALLLSDGTRREVDFVVAAVPWQHAASLVPDDIKGSGVFSRPADPGSAKSKDSRPLNSFARPLNLFAPITAVHLWFDRPITSLPHAVLVGRTSQWVFNHGWRGAIRGRAGWYCQVVISASHALVNRPAQAVLDEVREDLASIFAEARAANLWHWRVITHRAAVFSMQAGSERLRPPQRTPIPNFMLAGDWTATDWPATMEGAVRSGYLAVEAVLRALGRGEKLLVADLPRNPLVRLLCG